MIQAERPHRTLPSWCAAAIILLLAVLAWELGSSFFKTAKGARRLTPEQELAIQSSKLTFIVRQWLGAKSMLHWSSKDAPVPGPYYLVLDTDKHLLWLERGGKVSDVEKAPLSPGITEVWRETARGSTRLPSPVYLKVRKEAEEEEYFRITGNGDSSISGTCLLFDSHSVNLYTFPERPTVTWRPLAKAAIQGKEKPVSYLATAQEHEADLAALAQSAPRLPDPRDDIYFSEPARRWAGIRDRIAERMYKALATARLESTSMEYKPTPTFMTASARFDLKLPRLSLLDRIRPRAPIPYPREAEFIIRYLKDGVWGVCGLGPLAGMKFLVSDDPKRETQQYETLLAGMGAPTNGVSFPDPRFTAKLNDGTEVELVGLCELPLRPDSQWWKPDGMPMAEKPYYDMDFSLSAKLSDRKNRWVAYALRILDPATGGVRRRTTSWSHARGGSSFRATDEFGRIPKDAAYQGEALQFDSQQETADMTYNELVFKNISLYREKKTDFQILARQDRTDLPVE